MTYRVLFTPEAVEQLAALDRFLSRTAIPDVATDYVERIVAHCESLAEFPHRGTRRDDIRPGIRTVHFRKRVAIAFHADDPAKTVSILGVFYGGQDYESLLN